MDAVNFWFSPGAPDRLWFQFHFGTCPALAVDTASGSYQYILSQDVISPFSRLFFSFSDDVTITWTCTFWGYLRMSLVPSCISEMLAALLKNVSGPQAHISQAGWSFLSQNFGWLLLLSTFSLWIRSPLWLFPSHVYSLILVPPVLYFLEIYTAGKEPIWVKWGWSTS